MADPVITTEDVGLFLCDALEDNFIVMNKRGEDGLFDYVEDEAGRPIEETVETVIDSDLNNIIIAMANGQRFRITVTAI